MPVRGLTETPRVPRLGKIRLGEKVETQSRNGVRPTARPYFVCPPEVQAVYGEKPTELRILFLSDDESVVASQFYRAYKGIGLVCRGDGYNADASLDGDELEKRGGDVTQPLPLEAWASSRSSRIVRHPIACPGAGYDGGPACPMVASKGCGIRMFLQFAVIGVPGLGVWQMDTGSVVSIARINGTLTLLRSLVGHISGIPLTLRRVTADVQVEGKSKTVWVVELGCELDMLKLYEASQQKPVMHLLPPPAEEEADHDVDDEVTAESPPAQVIPAPSDDALSKLREAAGALPTAEQRALRERIVGAFPYAERDGRFGFANLSAEDVVTVLGWLQPTAVEDPQP